MKFKSIYLVCLIAVSFLWLTASCVKEENDSSDELRNVSMTMNVSARAGSDLEVGVEDLIESLRVYAFLGERQIGYYYAGNIQKNEQGNVSFVMDLALPAFSTISGNVRFYVIANELSVQPYKADVLSETMTRQKLENYRFMELNPIAKRSSLPMAVIQEVPIDPKEVIESTAQPGHWVLKGDPITFHLKRAVAKLGMFFAKKTNSGTLTIHRIEVLPTGLRDYNYLFEPTNEKLQQVTQNWQKGFNIGFDQPLTVDKVVTDEEFNSQKFKTQEEINQLSAFYTDGLPQPGYMFENCYGSDNPNQWGADDTNKKGFVVRVTYDVNGSQSQKDIYLPKTKRNAYYYVLNRIGIDGAVSIVYTVADWQNGGTSDIEWGHPTFTFEIGADMSEDCVISHDPDNEGATAKGVLFNFNMSAPLGQVWAASISNASDFTLWIDGEKASGDDATAPQMKADGKNHTLKVTANFPEEDTDRTTQLVIKSVMWGEANSNLNIDSSNKFPGGTSDILITQKGTQY